MDSYTTACSRTHDLNKTDYRLLERVYEAHQLGEAAKIKNFRMDLLERMGLVTNDEGGWTLTVLGMYTYKNECGDGYDD